MQSFFSSCGNSGGLSLVIQVVLGEFWLPNTPEADLKFIGTHWRAMTNCSSSLEET